MNGPTSKLAGLLDSRSDTRDMLSACPNLAHACIFLEQGEWDKARSDLQLGLQDASPDARVIGNCIKAELLRATGREAEAWELALKNARENRFHSAATLYLRLLFPLADEKEKPQPEPEASLSDPGAASVAMEPEADASRTEVSKVDAPAGNPPPVAAAMPEQPFPEGWQSLIDDESMVGISLVTSEGMSLHGSDLSALEPLLQWLSRDLFSRTGMGALQHAAFEGTARDLHRWNGRATLTALYDAGASAPMLTARLGKACRDLDGES